MRTQLARSITAIAAVATLSLTTSAQAQTRPLSDASSFLVAGMAQGQSQQARSTHANGFGFGVKGGLLFSSYREANTNYKNNNGWQAGIFFGGNRPGSVGVMGEILYAKKGAKDASGKFTADNYYLEIPVLLRLNIGSANRNTGAIVYGIAGPVADILLKADLNGVDVKKNYESLDLGIIAGGGVEVSRFLVEARMNWGLRNIAKATGGAASDVKTRSFAVLAGVRFN